MPPVTLDHCVIHVSDWELSNDFYRRVLGVDLIETPTGRWVYRLGLVQLNVHGPGASVGPLARVPVPPGGSDLCFEWKGPIEGAVQHLTTAGTTIELGPIERFGARGAGMSVYFRDPDGSLLEFISYT